MAVKEVGRKDKELSEASSIMAALLMKATHLFHGAFTVACSSPSPPPLSPSPPPPSLSLSLTFKKTQDIKRMSLQKRKKW